MKPVFSWLAVMTLGATTASAAPPANAQPGKEVFAETCMLCHGENGTPPPMSQKLGVANLASPAWQASRTDDQIRKVISDGSPKPSSLMRAFKDELPPEDIDALVKYIRTLGKPAPKKK